jgi:hypothetical protein
MVDSMNVRSCWSIYIYIHIYIYIYIYYIGKVNGWGEYKTYMMNSVRDVIGETLKTTMLSALRISMALIEIK